MINKKKRKNVIDLWNTGYKIPEIAQILHLWPNTVRNILRKEGLLGPPQPHRTKQVRVSTVDSSTRMNSWEQLPSPQQTPSTSDIDDGQFGRLIHELDKKNIKIEQQDEEIKKLKETISQLNTDLEKEKTQVEKLTTEKQVWANEKKQLTDLSSNETREKQRLQRQLNDLIDYIREITQTHQREREQQKKNDTLRESQMRTLQKDYHESLQKFSDSVKTMEGALNDKSRTIRTLEDDKNRLQEKIVKLEIILKKDKKKSFLIGLGLGAGAGGLIYYAIDQIFFKPAPSLPQKVVARKAVRCYPLPDGDLNNGVPLVTTSSGASCLGSFSYNNGDNNTSGYGVFPSQQNEVIQPDSGGTKGTTMSGIPGSGAFSGNTLGNNHIEPSIQNPQFIQNPPLLPIPTTNLPSYIPLSPPFNPADSHIMQRIWKMEGYEFELYLKGFFEYRDYHVELTKASGDKGADLILTRGSEIIVIQAKRWKSPVGTRAIEEVLLGKTIHHATRAIVICANKISDPALKDAEAAGVECWDGERLLKEIYTYQYFYLPE